MLIAVIAISLPSSLVVSLYGLKRLPSSTVGIILYINPLMGFVIAVTCYGERIDWQQALAYGIIVVSIFLFNWGNPALKAAFSAGRDPGGRVGGVAAGH